MATYLILNIAVCLVLAGVFLLKPARLNMRRLLIVLGVMLVMTAVFDSLIIANGIVAYDATHILGIYIGRAPLEDFFYAIVAAVLVPYLWVKWGKK